MRSCATALLLLPLAGCGRGISFLDPQGPVAQAQAQHFWWIIAVMMVVVLPVMVLVPLLIWRYRDGRGAEYRPKWSFSRIWETLIWGVPVLVVVALAAMLWPATLKLDPWKPIAGSQEPLHVEVVGYDWKWLFLYPDLGIASLNRLVIPNGQPVSLDLTSRTVMQSFWVPSLGSQVYAMYGMTSQLHLLGTVTGSFKGRNSQYNGGGFARQTFTADVVPGEQFDEWVARAMAHPRDFDAQVREVLDRPSTGADAARALGLKEQPAPTFTGIDAGTFDSLLRAAPAQHPSRKAEAAGDQTKDDPT